jgi:hypothetical protein
MAALGAQPALLSTAGAAAHRGRTALTIYVTGLPSHARGKVKLSEPRRKSRRITKTTKLKNPVPGTYTVRAQPVVVRARTYEPKISVCSAPRRCSAPSHGRIGVKAHHSVTVRIAYAVSKAKAKAKGKGKPKPGGSPQSPAAPVASPQPSPEGTLAPGKMETGGWSASINVPAGGPQAQVDGVISYPIRLSEVPTTVYLSERQVEAPGTVAGCEGSANRPIAQEGYLCVYQGATANNGSIESEWKNAKFFALEDFAGNIRGGKLGELVVFRTTTFTEPPTTLPAAAALTAAGSWAVTAKQ